MPETREAVKIALVTGYLGAGKTTLLNHILSNDRDLRAAVIVNDIGEVNIDAALIRDGGLSESDSVIPLTNGCICCTLSDDLAAQLGGITNSGDFDYIVIEASGICEPMPIAYTIAEYCAQASEDSTPLVLDNIVAVVDCARMISEFDGGHRLLDETLQEDDVDSHAHHHDHEGHDHGHHHHGHHYHHGENELEYGFSSFVYTRRLPFDLDKFGDFAAKWPDEVIRTKGMVWVSEQPGTCFLLEQAGTQRMFMDNGPFVASLPADEQSQVLAENPGIQARWDDRVGDRQTMLVFIGRNMDRPAIEEALDACLVEWQ